MLRKRAQILFDEETHDLLVQVAQQENISKGEAVRRAVRTVYQKRGKVVDKRTRAFEKMLKIREEIRKKYGNVGISFKDLIREGRRFDENSNY